MVGLLALLSVALSSTSNASVADWSRALNHHKVSICFADFDDLIWSKYYKFSRQTVTTREITSRERRKIKTEINRVFSESTTVAHFTGWTSCMENPRATIFIFGGEGQTHAVRTSGTKRHFKLTYSPNLFLYLNLNKDPSEELSAPQVGSLIREFAFALGLIDEVIRKEAIQDPQCKRAPHGFKIPSLATIKKLKTYSIYDPHSITHTCNPEPLELSSGDIHTLQCLYRWALPSFDKTTCAETYDPVLKKHIGDSRLKAE